MWAPTYDHDPNPLLALEERTLQSLLPDLHGKNVLDVACGTGRWLRKLLMLGARSGLGADLSSAMLAVACKKAMLQGRLVRADCLSLPVRCGVSDLVVCSFALGHAQDLTTFARELARVTRQRGRVFVTDVHAEGYRQGWSTGFRDAAGAVEIVTEAHSPEHVREAFVGEGLELRQSVEACLGEAEKPLFARAGRLDLFQAACAHPAIIVFDFVRRDSWADKMQELPGKKKTSCAKLASEQGN